MKRQLAIAAYLSITLHFVRSMLRNVLSPCSRRKGPEKYFLYLSPHRLPSCGQARAFHVATIYGHWENPGEMVRDLASFLDQCTVYNVSSLPPRQFSSHTGMKVFPLYQFDGNLSSIDGGRERCFDRICIILEKFASKESRILLH